MKVFVIVFVGCVLAAGTVISCSTTPAPFSVAALDFTGEQEYSDEYRVSFDFTNNSEKTVVSLEIAVPSVQEYLMRQDIVCTIPPGGSTRLEVRLNDTPVEPVTAAVTEIVYKDRSRFFDPSGRSSGLWW